MVANIRYFSPKLFRVKGRVPFVVLVVSAIGLAVVSSNPPIVLFVLGLIYALSGPFDTIWQSLREGTTKVESEAEESIDSKED